jgi:hypothetical protein
MIKVGVWANEDAGEDDGNRTNGMVHEASYFLHEVRRPGARVRVDR